MPHLPQPVRAHARALTPAARRAKRRAPAAEAAAPVEEIAVVASSGAVEAPAPMMAADGGEN